MEDVTLRTKGPQVTYVWRTGWEDCTVPGPVILCAKEGCTSLTRRIYSKHFSVKVLVVKVGLKKSRPRVLEEVS